MRIVGVGLNKTGTKTLAHYLKGLGMRHRSFEYDAFQLYRQGRTTELLDSMEGFDSFEDWPWPLIWRQIEERYPDTRFILTVRKDADTWYRSLCHMAVRMGPLKDYEQHIYGYAMPQGRRREHIDYYERHNQEVMEHFAGQSDRFVRICWEEPGALAALSEFLGTDLGEAPVHTNKSSRRVYRGDNLWIAHAVRLAYRPYWYGRQALARRSSSRSDS